MIKLCCLDSFWNRTDKITTLLSFFLFLLLLCISGPLIQTSEPLCIHENISTQAGVIWWDDSSVGGWCVNVSLSGLLCCKSVFLRTGDGMGLAEDKASSKMLSSQSWAHHLFSPNLAFKPTLIDIGNSPMHNWSDLIHAKFARFEYCLDSLQNKAKPY